MASTSASSTEPPQVARRAAAAFASLPAGSVISTQRSSPIARARTASLATTRAARVAFVAPISASARNIAASAAPFASIATKRPRPVARSAAPGASFTITWSLAHPPATSGAWIHASAATAGGALFAPAADAAARSRAAAMWEGAFIDKVSYARRGARDREFRTSEPYDLGGGVPHNSPSNWQGSPQITPPDPPTPGVCGARWRPIASCSFIRPSG